MVHIYCDEAGTMPVSDGDDVLVAGVFATIPPLPEDLPLHRSNPEWTAKLLSHCNALPNCIYVKPFPGYEELLKLKMDAYRFVAETDQRLGRARHVFRTYEAIRPRNFTWMVAMEMAVQMSVLPMVLKRRIRIDEVRVFLDSKTLDREIGRFFPEFMKELGSRMVDALGKAEEFPLFSKEQVRQAQEAQSRSNISPDNVRIEWDDDPHFSGLPAGICLADSVASNTYGELTDRNRKPGLFWELDQVGIRRDYLKDVTHHVCRVQEIHRLDDWQRETGVAIPQLRRLRRLQG